MPIQGQKWERSVFLNVPFDKSYEPLFVALISVVVSLGRTPRCVLEIPETGQGRLPRILSLLRSCSTSIHDLSRVGLPARFNMPFELGIAFTVSRMEPPHGFVILEAKRHRLLRTLSDVNGFDPGIHGATIRGITGCVLSHLGRSRGNPPLGLVLGIQGQLQKLVPHVKRKHGRTNIYSRAIFGELVEGASRLARKNGLIGG